MIRYRTRQDDMVDWICWKHYGKESGRVEQVLAANEGLADYGSLLPAGLMIMLPDIDPTPQTVIRLWD